MIHTSLILSLPVWMEPFLERFVFPMGTVEERMRFVVAMSLENVRRKTGGPFAAAIFDRKSGGLISTGVNCVVPLNCSLAHAEMLAIGCAQQRLQTFNLGAAGFPETELVSSTEPCAMCLGALQWAGVTALVCGATDADARVIGFDEGIKPAGWMEELTKRGISVATEICRKEALDVLRFYKEQGGVIYNGGAQSGDEKTVRKSSSFTPDAPLPVVF